MTQGQDRPHADPPLPRLHPPRMSAPWTTPRRAGCSLNRERFRRTERGPPETRAAWEDIALPRRENRSAAHTAPSPKGGEGGGEEEPNSAIRVGRLTFGSWSGSRRFGAKMCLHRPAGRRERARPGRRGGHAHGDFLLHQPVELILAHADSHPRRIAVPPLSEVMHTCDHAEWRDDAPLTGSHPT